MVDSERARASNDAGFARVRHLAWLFLAFKLVVLDGLELFRARSINDYASFHFAALAIRDGKSPYDFSYIVELGREFGLGGLHPYFYPPLLAELLFPSSFLALWPARLLWWFLNVAAFAYALARLDRWMAARSSSGGARALFAVASAFFWPIRETQWMGQVNAIVLLAIVLWWTSRDRSKWAVAWLAAAIAVKMSPAILLLVPLAERRWREAATGAAMATLAILLSCAVLGGRGFEFLSGVLPTFAPGRSWHALSVPIDLIGNESLAAFAFALAGHAISPVTLTPEARRIYFASIAIVLAGWLFAAFRARSDWADGDARLGALLVAMVILPTYAYEHHLVYVLPAIAIVAMRACEAKLSRVEIAIAAIAVVIVAEPVNAMIAPRDVTGLLARLAHLPKLAPLLALFAILCRKASVSPAASAS